jgi:hypothetical protein
METGIQDCENTGSDYSAKKEGERQGIQAGGETPTCRNNKVIKIVTIIAFAFQPA